MTFHQTYLECETPCMHNHTPSNIHVPRYLRGQSCIMVDAVNEGRSKLNVIHIGKLSDLSVTLQDQGKKYKLT
jgi:hypothetical protein